MKQKFLSYEAQRWLEKFNKQRADTRSTFFSSFKPSLYIKLSYLKSGDRFKLILNKWQSSLVENRETNAYMETRQQVAGFLKF